MSQLFFKNYPAAISQTWKAHFTVTVNAHCATTHNSNGKGQRSRSHKAEDRFGGLVEALFLTPLGRAAFVVDRGTACTGPQDIPACCTQCSGDVLS